MGKIVNLARVAVVSTGTGTLTLGAASTGFLTFAQAGVVNGDTVSYSIDNGSQSEVGRGVWNSSANTLTRTVIRSTNNNAAINVTAGATCALTLLAEDLTPAELGAAPTQHNHTVNQLTDFPAILSANRMAVLTTNSAGNGLEWSRHPEQYDIITLTATTTTLSEFHGGCLIVNTSTAQRTVNLPSTAPFVGWTCTFARMNTGTIVLNGNGRNIQRNSAETATTQTLWGRSGENNAVQIFSVVWTGGVYLVKEEKYDYQPVQMGGGTSMGSNNIKLGWDGGAVRIQIDGTSFVLPHQNPSDENIKRDIADAEADALSKLRDLRMIAFNFKEGLLGLDPKVRHEVGFSAQELERVEPMWVRPRVHKTDHLMPDQQLIFPYLVRAIQQLADRVEELESKLQGGD